MEKREMEENAKTIINGEIVKDALMEYYTVVHTYDGFAWYGTGILHPNKEEALKSFGTWGNVKDFRLVKIILPILLRETLPLTA